MNKSLSENKQTNEEKKSETLLLAAVITIAECVKKRGTTLQVKMGI